MSSDEHALAREAGFAQRAVGLWPMVAAATAIGLGAAIALLPQAQLITAVGVIVALAAVTAIFHEPVLGLALVMIVGPFQPLERVSLQLPIDSGQIILGLTLLSYAARALATRRSPISYLLSPISVPLALFVAVCLLSFFPTRDFADWANECIKWVQMLVVALLVMNERDGRKRAIVIGAILLSAAGQAIFGIIQADVRGFGPREFQVLGSKTNFRAYGTFEQPNPFGGYMGLVWPLAAGIALGAIYDLRFTIFDWLRGRSAQAHRDVQSKFITTQAVVINPGVSRHSREGGNPDLRRHWIPAFAGMTIHSFAMIDAWPEQLPKIQNLKSKIVIGVSAGLVAALCLAALVASGSRGGFVGAAAAAVVFVLALLKHPARWVGAAVLIGLLLLGLHIVSIPLSLDEQVQQLLELDVRNAHILPTTFSTIERLAHWQAAVRMIDANPWLGVGFGNYGAAYPDYKLFIWDNALGHAHNYYLNIFAETGVIGFIAYLALWATVFVVTWRLSRYKVAPAGSPDPAAYGGSDDPPEANLQARRSPFSILNFQFFPRSRLAGGSAESGIGTIGLLAAFAALTAHHVFDNLYVANMHLLIGVYLGLVGALWLEHRHSDFLHKEHEENTKHSKHSISTFPSL